MTELDTITKGLINGELKPEYELLVESQDLNRDNRDRILAGFDRMVEELKYGALPVGVLRAADVLEFPRKVPDLTLARISRGELIRGRDHVKLVVNAVLLDPSQPDAEHTVFFRPYVPGFINDGETDEPDAFVHNREAFLEIPFIERWLRDPTVKLWIDRSFKDHRFMHENYLMATDHSGINLVVGFVSGDVDILDLPYKKPKRDEAGD